MTFSCKPSRLAIYVNTARKTVAQIKQETGCTALINGGLFNMSTFSPVCQLKVDGKLLASDQYTYWGYGWTGDGFPALVSDYSKIDNYIACVPGPQCQGGTPVLFRRHGRRTAKVCLWHICRRAGLDVCLRRQPDT